MVSDDDLEVELRFVRGHAAGSLAGVFGPDSATWRVNREAAIFLGAGRALLLQLAHPSVAILGFLYGPISRPYMVLLPPQRDSLVILKIARMKAGMSAGWREVTRLPSTTTSQSR